MTTIHTLKDALALADHSGRITVHGTLEIATSLVGITWSNRDSTGLVINARNLESVGGNHCIHVHELNISGFIKNFEAITSDYIHAGYIEDIKHIRGKHIKADRVDVEILEAWAEPRIRDLRTIFYTPPETSEPSGSVADIVNRSFSDMPAVPVSNNKSFYF